MDKSKKVEELQKQRFIKNQELMKQGVFIHDPNNTYIDDDVEIGEESIIYPNVHILNGSKIGKRVTILPNSFLSNAVIQDDTIIDSSKIMDSTVGANSSVGPMSHLRNKTIIGDHARIGNFVEIKNTNFGNGSKCAHLTYLGDSDIGSGVNFGCGVVTVNYDGKNKFRTTIGDGAFIGSNVNLIAPIHIGNNALLAAGSTIYEDVEDGAMGIARSYQQNKKDLGKKYKDK